MNCDLSTNAHLDSTDWMPALPKIQEQSAALPSWLPPGASSGSSFFLRHSWFHTLKIPSGVWFVCWDKVLFVPFASFLRFVMCASTCWAQWRQYVVNQLVCPSLMKKPSSNVRSTRGPKSRSCENLLVSFLVSVWNLCTQPIRSHQPEQTKYVGCPRHRFLHVRKATG